MKTLIKLCGLYRDIDIEYANIVNPDFIGFVFAKSKRQVSKEKAIELKSKLNKEIKSVGVFVDSPNKEIIDIYNSKAINMIQLHGNETEDDILYLKAHTNAIIIKAVIIEDINSLLPWIESSADFLLFDSGKGSGNIFNWEYIKSIKRPYFLGGGINIENVIDAIKYLSPYAIDTSSGIETNGVKDLFKMKNITNIIRNINDN